MSVTLNNDVAHYERVATPELRALSFDDYEKASALLRSYSFGVPEYEDWHRLWVDNPLWSKVKNKFPIGWVLETPRQEIVGILGAMPTLYVFDKQELISLTGTTWLVTAPYRGFALHLVDEYFNQPADLFINTTVGQDASASFEALSSRIPLGSWDVMTYWVTSYRGFAEKALRKFSVPFARPLARPFGAALRFKDNFRAPRFPHALRSYSIESIHHFDSSFDLFWTTLLRHNDDKLLAQRDAATLSYHFGIPMRAGKVWIFGAFRNRQLRAYCVLTQQDHLFKLGNGKEKPFRGMRFADYQTIEADQDLLPGFLNAAMQRCRKEGIDFLENLGYGVPKMRAFDEHAPYKSPLDNWKFMYHAADASLEQKLHNPQYWDPSPFDGDASLE